MGSPSAPLRVLMITPYFPHPANALIGPWALDRALALKRKGVDLRVVVPTSWVPKALHRIARARSWATAPASHLWSGLHVDYPRWLYYPVPPLRQRLFESPRGQTELGWLTLKPALERLVRAHDPQVVYVHGTAPAGYLALRLKRRHGLPFVIADFDFGEVTACETLPRRRVLYEEVLGEASAHIAAAKKMEGEVRRLFPFAATQTIHQGISTTATGWLQRPRPPELVGKRVVFAAGTFYERKGIPLLVRAFARAAGSMPDAVLRIAGDGAERPLIEAAIREHGLSRQVALLGFLSHEAVQQEMAWSDVFALPGWDEPFATVFLEAMALGRPIICASDGGITDVVEDGVHGLIVPPRDDVAAAAALARLLTDEPARLRMGQAAAEMVASKLSWDAMAGRLVGVMEAAAQLKSRGSRGP